MNNSHMLIAMQQMLFYTIMAVCIVTIPTLLVGLLISIFQAGTQINEMTLTFVPKLMVMFGLLFLISPWLMNKLVLITKFYLLHLPTYIR